MLRRDHAMLRPTLSVEQVRAQRSDVAGCERRPWNVHETAIPSRERRGQGRCQPSGRRIVPAVVVTYTCHA